MTLTQVLTFDLVPGQEIVRKELHDRFGGRRQGGIGPSIKIPAVFIFTDPATGAQHGYYDGWGTDGHYHYVGEGQRGDQNLMQGNGAIARSVQDDRQLLLFSGVSGTVKFIGEFTLATDHPYYWTDAPETGGGPLRSVVVFRLKPTDPVSAQAALPFKTNFIPTAFPAADTAQPSAQAVKEISLEVQTTEKTVLQPQSEEIEMERREHKLVLEYGRFLQAKGHKVTRHQILPDGEAKPLFTDAYDVDDDVLIEAKGTVTREAIRMALGQLMDYQRYVRANYLAVLLPSKPRPDLLALIKSQGVQTIWPTDDGFHTEMP
ncbi:hypothetical protein [Deinococcus soli (ex Cha et al. 2016)]|uniref:Uncharacterized protein n=2 Tax=Deinococcus soli (ex Cha et al. 2016) TaxID=1309411 RepID=A0ACC6KI61_9DEIO|nr:hypothetical protein [Deinococcus soli (ex Cha et al. 2016)]MDR6219214.1 hypothetical protein [Deinococcus soli (ex Cha et al. 2016)]MDR6329463.1 hypothetical protein [Deinococcus soli (ex Cha et al. 2016)]MDR6752123.1 hypothetical protein [Deinococcus soli (ex Cha et al. 2016)]